MTQIVSLYDVGQIINSVLNMFLDLEVMPNVKLSYVIVVVISLSCVFSMLVNDGD